MTPQRRVALILFGITGLVYGLSAPGHLQTVDIRAEFAVAQSIVSRGDFTVNPNLPFVTVPAEVGPDGRGYTHHGVGTSLLLLPAAVAGKLAGCPDGPAACPAGAQHLAEFVAGFLDPVCAALTAALFFLFAVRLGVRIRPAAATTLLLALSTSQWAYAHDTFDVVPTGLFTLLAFYGMYRGVAGDGHRWLVISGAAAGFTVLLRLPSVLVLPALAAWLAWATLWPRPGLRRAAVVALAWGVPLALSLLLLAWYNWARFGDPMESGYGLATDTYPFSTPILEGLAGQLLSPGKSLFLFAPGLLVALVGTVAFGRRHLPLALAIAAVSALELGFYGTYQEWAGDWAWGPRYLVPLVPVLMLPATVVLERWRDLGAASRAGVVAVAALGAGLQLLDVGIDFQHQIELKFDDGIQLHSYWTLEHSAIWRHAVALWGVVTGSARYPPIYQFTDLSLGMPTVTTVDTWWMYAWIQDAARPAVAVVLAGAVAATAWLVGKLRAELSR